MTLHSIAPQVLASGPDLLQIEAWARVAIGRVLNFPRPPARCSKRAPKSWACRCTQWPRRLPAMR